MQKKTLTLIPLMMLLLVSCLAVTKSPERYGTSATSSSSVAGTNELGARIIFEKDNFVDIEDFLVSQNSVHQCLGDVLKIHYVNGDDYMGTPTALPTPSSSQDTLLPTNRPAFVKNVSVDITQTYYELTQSNFVLSDVCSYRGIATAPSTSTCADFDRVPSADPAPTVAPTATPNPTPVPTTTPATAEYFNSGYYRVRDDWCTTQGPVISADPDATKAGVGGVNIDLDRTQLGSNEDLLMMVTYHSLNENSTEFNWPGVLGYKGHKDTVTGLDVANASAHGIADRTILKVNLIATQQSLDDLLLVKQPRAWVYANTSSYPIYLKEIATLEDPYGSLRTEQVYIPLSQNGLVDRIRIERVRGSFHLFQIDLYRLGNRAD